MACLPLFKRILAAGKSILVDVPMDELDEFMHQMPREGVFLCLGVQDGQEAAIIHYLRHGDAVLGAGRSAREARCD